MNCITNDWYQGAAVPDGSQAEPRWYWLTSDTNESFRERWKTPERELWEQDALAQIATGDATTGYCRNTYYSLRSALFARLMNNVVKYRGPARVGDFSHFNAIKEFLRHRAEFVPLFRRRLHGNP
jgi:hypothetical protein